MLRQTHEQFKVTLQLQRMSVASGMSTASQLVDRYKNQMTQKNKILQR
jgi:hypothetical protein